MVDNSYIVSLEERLQAVEAAIDVILNRGKKTNTDTSKESETGRGSN